MKHTLFLLLASGLALTACKKAVTAGSSTGSAQPVSQSGGDLAELKKTPDAAKMLESWVYSKRRCFAEEAFEIAAPKVVVKRADNDRFEVYAEYTATAKSDLYSVPLPSLVTEDNGATVPYSVIELLERKGTKKVRYFHCLVRHGPMNSGRNPEKIMWNWEKPEETGDAMQIYEPGGFLAWATAEAYKINSEGTASSNPRVLIRGTPHYQKSVVKHPRLAETDADRAKERDQMGDEYMKLLKDKQQLDRELLEQLKKHFAP